MNLSINEKNNEIIECYDKIQSLRNSIEQLKYQKDIIKDSLDDEKEAAKRLQRQLDNYGDDKANI